MKEFHLFSFCSSHLGPPPFFPRWAWITLSFFLVSTSVAFSQIESANDGPWNIGTTWVGGLAPIAGDDVIIKAGDTVTINNHITSFDAMTIEATGGLTMMESTTITGDSITNHGTMLFDFTFNNTTHRVNSDIVNNGTITHDGYFMDSDSSSTITNNGTLNLNFNSWAGVNVVNTSSGQVNVNALNLIFPTVFTNQSGGTLTVPSGKGITFTNSLSNEGTVNVTGGIGLNGGTHFFNGGSFGGTGTLFIGVGGATIDAPTGFTPSFANVQMHNLSQVLAGTPGTSMTIPGTTTFSVLNSSTFVGFSGITNHGTMLFGHTFNNQTHRINSDIVNNGTITHDGYHMASDSSSTITNNGTLNLNFNSWAGVNVVNTSGGQVNANASISNFPTVFTNQAGGKLTVPSGMSITFTDSLSNSGTVDVTGTLVLNGGAHHFDGGSFGGTGDLSIGVGGATIDAPSGFTPTFADVLMSSLTTTLAGTPGTVLTIPAGTDWSMLNNSTFVGFSGITNHGTMLFDNTFNNTTHKINSDIVNNGTITHNGYFMDSDSSSTITNNGTLNLNFNSWADVNVVNTSGGQVNVNAPNLIFPTVFTNQAGGTLTVPSGKGITFTNSLSNAGTVNVTGGIGLNGGTHFFNGGSFGGTGTLFIGVGGATIDAPTGFTPSFANVQMHNLSQVLAGTPGTVLTIPASTDWSMLNNSTVTGFDGIINNGTMTLGSTFNNTTNRIESDVTNNGTIEFNGWFTAGRADTTYVTNNGSLVFNTTLAINDLCFNNGATGSITINVNRTLPCVSGGGSLTVGSGATYTVPVASAYPGTCIVEAGAILNYTDTANDPIVTGDTLVNNGTITLPAGRTLVFGGTGGLQTLTGNGTISSLGINNPDNLSITGNQTVTGELRFYNGCYILGSGNLITGSVVGSSSSRYVVTTGSGYLGCPVNTSTTTFPIGPTTSIYAPATLQQTSGSATFGVSVAAGISVPTEGPDYVDCLMAD